LVTYRGDSYTAAERSGLPAGDRFAITPYDRLPQITFNGRCRITRKA
jgi:hypothetical protein